MGDDEQPVGQSHDGLGRVQGLAGVQPSGQPVVCVRPDFRVDLGSAQVDDRRRREPVRPVLRGDQDLDAPHRTVRVTARLLLQLRHERAQSVLPAGFEFQFVQPVHDDQQGVRGSPENARRRSWAASPSTVGATPVIDVPVNETPVIVPAVSCASTLPTM